MKLSSLVITELKNLSAASRLQMQTTQVMLSNPSAMSPANNNINTTAPMETVAAVK